MHDTMYYNIYMWNYKPEKVTDVPNLFVTSVIAFFDFKTLGL